jgi:hypothetical protein
METLGWVLYFKYPLFCLFDHTCDLMKRLLITDDGLYPSRYLLAVKSHQVLNKTEIEIK